jgi:hypothetical protein
MALGKLATLALLATSSFFGGAIAQDAGVCSFPFVILGLTFTGTHDRIH